jgi:ABC-type antimicrobial peptide transport system permease subunit
LVNESVVKKLGLASPENILGKTILVNRWSAPVVGVVRDFHDQSLHSMISPIAVTTSIANYNIYSVKIKMQNMNETLTALEKAWSTTYPEQIFDYDFLDDHIASFYQAEDAMLKMVQVFSGIALFIGSIGLYGLVSFMAVQKTKEIGIRKVLGGNVVQILWIFGKEFTVLVAMAFLIAAPIGWLIMTEWLSNYAFKVEIGIWVFVLELIIVLAIVLVTVGYRSVHAALANPVKSLRTE